MRPFLLQVSIVVALLAASSAPTPLYAVWQARWGFSPLTITVIFAAYALAVLAGLLLFGSLSDHVGRRPVIAAALAVQVVSLAMFAAASGVEALLVARVLQGLSTGTAVAALGAGLLDLDRGRGSVANAVAPMSGTGLGSIGSALVVQLLPEPTTLVFVLLGGLLLVQLAGVALMPETAPRRPGAWAALRPQLRVPAAARGPFLLALPALVAAWAVPGFYGSLGPAVLRTLAGSQAPVFGGLPLFVMAGSGAVAVLLTLSQAPQRMLIVGSAALAVGTGLTLIGISQATLLVFVAGAVISGAGFGLAFQGGIRAVVPFATANERAGLISALLVVAYVSFGAPAVLAGLRVAQVGLGTTALEFGAFVMALATLSLVRALMLSAPVPSLNAERKSP